MNPIDALASGTFEPGNAPARLAQGQPAQGGANDAGTPDQTFSTKLESSLQQIAAGTTASDENGNVTNCVIVKPSANAEQLGGDFEDDAELAASESSPQLLIDQLLTLAPSVLTPAISSVPQNSPETAATGSTDTFSSQAEADVPQIAPESKPPALPAALMQTGIPQVGSSLTPPKQPNLLLEQAVPQKKSDNAARGPIEVADNNLLDVSHSSTISPPSAVVGPSIQNIAQADSNENNSLPADPAETVAPPVVISEVQSHAGELANGDLTIPVPGSVENVPASVNTIPVKTAKVTQHAPVSATFPAQEPLPTIPEILNSNINETELAPGKSTAPAVSNHLNRPQKTQAPAVTPVPVNPQNSVTVAKQSVTLADKASESSETAAPETVDVDLSLKGSEPAIAQASEVESVVAKSEIATTPVENTSIFIDDNSEPDDEKSRVGDKLEIPSTIASDKPSHADHVKHVSSNTDAPPDVNVGRVISDVSRGVTTARDAGHEIHLRLDPRELGGLQIHVTMQDGQLTARLEAERASSHRILSDNLSQLRDQLTQQGVQVDRIEVVHIGEHSGAGNTQANMHSFRQQERQPQFSSTSETGRNLRRDAEPEQNTSNARLTPTRTSRAKIRELDITV